VPISGATGKTYATSAQDAGSALHVRVTADHVDGCGFCTPWFPDGPGAADSAETAVLRYASALTLKARQKRHGRTKVVIALSAGEVPARVVVVLTDGRKRVGRVTLRDGVGRATLRLAKGRHRLTGSYAGAASVDAASATVRLRVR
jgi:hypothetical protein